jgi:hypothetical protein
MVRGLLERAAEGERLLIVRADRRHSRLVKKNGVRPRHRVEQIAAFHEKAASDRLGYHAKEERGVFRPTCNRSLGPVCGLRTFVRITE